MQLASRGRYVLKHLGHEIQDSHDRASDNQLPHSAISHVPSTLAKPLHCTSAIMLRQTLSHHDLPYLADTCHASILEPAHIVQPAQNPM